VARRKARRISRGVKRIIAILEEKKLKYVKELRFPDCKDIRPLPFDFSVYNGKELVCLIEFNGVQHYKFCRKFHKSKKGLFKQQKHDAIKLAFCAEKSIPLLVIHYEEEKIEEICIEFLIKCGILFK